MIIVNTSKCVVGEKVLRKEVAPMPFEYYKKAFSLSKRKLDDRVHVYCTLNLDMINNIEQVIYNDTLKLYTDKWPEQIIGK